MRAFFLITIFIISTNFQSSICYDDPQFIECSRSFSCKTFTNLSYPFWGDGRPNYCGHPGFELRCPEFASYPVIKINNLDFRILKINHSNYRKAMTIARLDVFGDLCALKKIKTTLNPDLNYAETASNLTLLYECKRYLESVFVPTLPNSFSCDGDTVFYVDDSFLAAWMNDTAAWMNDLYGYCDSIAIPIFQTALEKLRTGFSQMAQQDDLSQRAQLGEAFREGFELELKGIGRLCGDCEESGGRCGFDYKTAQFACFCRDQPQVRVCPSPGKRDWELKVGIAVGAGVLAIMLTCIMIYCFIYNKSKISSKNFFKRRTHSDRNLEAFIRDYAHMNAKRYRFSDVKKMTNSFKDRLGQGGYGEVYRGKLLDGSLVAVKVLDSSKGIGQDFINEVASIGRTSHVNVVTLLGFCLEGNKRALIYEYMPNGSLEKFVYNESPLLVTPRLEWEKLLQIATGIARGLEYLHRGCNTRILHFDIKPHNILLDEDLCPKISDFGLAKLCQKKESIVSMLDARGTIGYIAPEVWSRNFGGVSSKSDVYSYGMMTLEMAGGRKNVKVGESESSEIYFPDWIYKYLELNNNNVEWQGIRTNDESEIARKMLVVGLWCIQTKPADRPSMSKVIEMLEGSLEALQIPPKPYMFSPRSPEVWQNH